MFKCYGHWHSECVITTSTNIIHFVTPPNLLHFKDAHEQQQKEVKMPTNTKKTLTADIVKMFTTVNKVTGSQLNIQQTEKNKWGNRRVP